MIQGEVKAPSPPVAAALRRASVISMAECEFLTLDCESYSRLVSQHIAQKQTDQQLTLLRQVGPSLRCVRASNWVGELGAGWRQYTVCPAHAVAARPLPHTRHGVSRWGCSPAPGCHDDVNLRGLSDAHFQSRIPATQTEPVLWVRSSPWEHRIDTVPRMCRCRRCCHWAWSD
jgi:hypothetical protein